MSESPQEDQAAEAVEDGAAQDKSKTPEEIRAEIDQTREEMGDTVEALAAKTDVKAQASDRIATVKENVSEKKDEFVSKAKQATPESASAGAAQLGSTVQDKPLPFAAVGAFAAGLAVGWLLGRR
jgi:ElaB/YqjD/DUF883 family membrane-anchored ribosome-binding protein